MHDISKLPSSPHGHGNISLLRLAHVIYIADMGWLWGSGDSSAKPSDPYKDLDPTLKEFLDNESPSKHPSSASPPQPASKGPSTPGAPASRTYRSQITPSSQTPSTAASATSATNPNGPPPESLYPDGRYAHLWSTYRPLSEIEAATKSDSDRLRDIIDSYNDRKAAIGRAAVENCVLEQMAERDCWENGSFWERANLCRGRNREFLRCYTMQTKFLKALGYLSEAGDGERDERVQMHADRLYHELRDREEAAERARQEGVEVPVQPIIDSKATTEALGKDSAFARLHSSSSQLPGGSGLKLSDYTPERQEQVKKQLEGLSPAERELEMQLIAAERRAQLEVSEKINERYREEAVGRRDRRERGRETVGDTLKRMWGWDGEK